MRPPAWMRDWQVYLVAFLILLLIVLVPMILTSKRAEPAPSFTPVQLPTK